MVLPLSVGNRGGSNSNRQGAKGAKKTIRKLAFFAPLR